uniref:ORF1a polyprotein n=1 Tax=Lettuce chlorosis virus TaxID=642478 RepID=A0A5C1ISC4_9CLOS|nr:ORF1a polyprotein [Lettuce chlorosis virus]
MAVMSHSLQLNDCVVPLVGPALDSACVPQLWSAGAVSCSPKNPNNNNNNSINKKWSNKKQTRLGHVKTSEVSPASCVRTKVAFRRRLVSPGISPVEVIILSNGDARLVPQPRSFYKTRLDMLRKICNIPHCRFNRMPQAVINKLGYDVDEINKVIDQALNSKVGGTPENIRQPDETIQGSTKYGDGYCVSNYNNKSNVDIFICFNSYVKNIYMCRFNLQLKYNKQGQAVDVLVSLIKAYGKTPGQHFCKPFLLSQRLDTKQFYAKVLLASVMQKIPDYSEFYGVYMGKLFCQRIAVARSVVFAACQQYLNFMKSKVGVTKPELKVTQVPKKNATPQSCSVKHFVRRSGYEFFVVKFSDGSEHRINNSRYAIKEMYNLTFNNGFYYIHPMCYTPNYDRFGSCGNFYCWIPAFSKAKLRMPRDLVPYPELNYGYLVQCGLEKVMRNRLRRVKDDYFHFDVNYNEKPHFLKFGSKVGVKLENEADGIIKNIEVLFDDISAGIISGTQTRSDNPLLNTITSHLSNEINKQCNKPKDLVIPTCMSSKQKKELCELFPEINFDFTESSYSTHALATAMRHAENYLLAKKYGFRNFIDAGGDITHYLHKTVEDVHVCSPVVDLKDAHRHMTRSNKLDRMTGMCENVDMCEYLTQECYVVKPNIIAVQVYDMTLEDFARALRSHEAKRVDFTMIIPPEIYDEDCDVSLFDDTVNVKCEGNTVKYTYGDSGEVYSHNRDNLKQILATQIFEVDGVIYKKTLENSRKQLHFYSVVPCSDMMNGSYVTESHYSRSELDKLCIRVPVENELKTIEHMKIKMDKACFHNLIEYAMNTVLRLDEKAFEYILSQYRARKSISIRGGKVTQVGADMHPKAVAGLIGAVAGYGLRLREQSHKAARVAYLEYYTPSLFGMICKIIAYILKKFSNWTHKFLMDVLKYLTPKSILNEVTNNQCSVYEFIGEYRFKQHVTIIGTKSKRSILTESFEKFKSFSDKNYENLDTYTAERGDLFTPDIQQTLNDIFDLGGGECTKMTKRHDIWQTPYSTYMKLYLIINCWLRDEKRSVRYTNYICGIWDYFKSFGLSTIEFVKSILVELMTAIKNGFTNLSSRVVSNLQRAARTMYNLTKKRNSNWEDQLSKMLDDTDKIYGSTLRGDVKEPDVNHEHIETMSLDQLFDMGNEGGSGKFGSFIHYHRNMLVRKSNRYYYTLKVMVQWIVDSIFKCVEWAKTSYRSFRGFVKHTVEMMLETKNLTMIIDTTAFTFTNLLMALMIGDLSLIRVFVSSCLSAYLRFSKTGVKWFGSNTVGDAMSTLITNPGINGIVTAPIVLVGSRVIGKNAKLTCASIIKDEEKSLALVANEVNTKYYFNWFTPEVLRSLIGVSTIILLMYPKLGISLIITLILLNDYVKYLRSVCVMANVYLSYGSVLKRTVPTGRYKKLKEIFSSKFDKSLFTSKNRSNDQVERESEGAEEICRVGRTEKASDVEVELGYDGIEVNKRQKHVNWGSEVSSANASDFVDGLQFSVLKPCVDRTQINCAVHFPISHALLRYPMTDCHDFIPTGDMLLDCVNEYYHLEAKKLHDEMGRVNNAVRVYFEHQLETKSVKDAIWAMRNYFNDSSVYMNINSKAWYRLAKGDKGPSTIEAVCKYSLDNDLIDFNTNHSNVVVCSDEMMGMFSNKRCLALESILKTSQEKIKAMRSKDVVFYNKPPGAGKTTSIVTAMVEDVKNGIVSVALTHTSNGKKEIINKLKAKGVSAAQKMVYTYDSVLMNDTESTVDKVYCDEIFMVHAGEWLAVMSLYKTNYIRCYGDRNQIPFINRVAHTVCRYHKDIYLTFKTIDDNISYRCPVDICYLLSTLTDEAGNLLYPNGVYPAGDNRNVFRSVEIEGITGIHDITFDSQSKCISFTRPEREEIDTALQRSGVQGLSVQTVHEVQGGTFPSVNLHRLRKYDNPLYENINQFVVSISRHTERMKYRVITDKMFDRIGERISALSNVQDYIIKEHMFKQRV